MQDLAAAEREPKLEIRGRLSIASQLKFLNALDIDMIWRGSEIPVPPAASGRIRFSSHRYTMKYA